VRLFPPLFPTVEPEDPDAELAAGSAPGLRELRLHNGTVWRWNRPVYDVQSGRPQLRIENRVLPSGPTAVDMVANAAFYYGLVRAIVDSDPAPWEQVPFALAERDLHRAARDGLAAQLSWQGIDYPVDRLTREVLLPAAAAGLDAWGVDPDDRDRYLGVIEARVRCGRTGAVWQTEMVRHLEERGLERVAAIPSIPSCTCNRNPRSSRTTSRNSRRRSTHTLRQPVVLPVSSSKRRASPDGRVLAPWSTTSASFATTTGG
jgi:hypothetical protein